MKNPKKIVKTGFDKVSYAYREDNPDKNSKDYKEYKSWADEVSSKLKPRASILELGCGCGVPTTKLLSEQFNVTGVDLSPVQINRAKELVPDATFICDDIL